MRLLFFAFSVCLMRNIVESTFCGRRKQKNHEPLSNLLHFIFYLAVPLIFVFDALKFIISLSEPIILHLVIGAEDLMFSDYLHRLQLISILYHTVTVASIEVLLVSLLSLGCSAAIITGHHIFLDSKLDIEPMDPFSKICKRFYERKQSVHSSNKIFLRLGHLRN